MMANQRFIDREIGGEIFRVDLEQSYVRVVENDPAMNHVVLIGAPVVSQGGEGFDGFRRATVFKDAETFSFFSGVRLDIEGRTEEDLDQLSRQLEYETGRLLPIVFSEHPSEDEIARFTRAEGKRLEAMEVTVGNFVNA